MTKVVKAGIRELYKAAREALIKNRENDGIPWEDAYEIEAAIRYIPSLLDALEEAERMQKK